MSVALEKPNKYQWHRHFAWWPVRTHDTSKVIWLQTVDRIRVCISYDEEEPVQYWAHRRVAS